LFDIASVVASCNTTFFFGAKIFNPQKLNVFFFSSKPQKFHTAEITGYTVFRDSKFQTILYPINHISVEALTTGKMVVF
jgi:hypothetical protein